MLFEPGPIVDDSYLIGAYSNKSPLRRRTVLKYVQAIAPVKFYWVFTTTGKILMDPKSKPTGNSWRCVGYAFGRTATRSDLWITNTTYLTFFVIDFSVLNTEFFKNFSWNFTDGFHFELKRDVGMNQDIAIRNCLKILLLQELNGKKLKIFRISAIRSMTLPFCNKNWPKNGNFVSNKMWF